jgi:tetratricopeptide (TPR) repeat protein
MPSESGSTTSATPEVEDDAGAAVRRARQALDTRRRALEADHPDTLSSLAELARGLHVQRRFAEAEEHLGEAVERRRRVLGGDHPDTVESMDALACALLKQGKHEEARLHVREVLDSRKRVLGEEHPETFKAGRNLTVLLCKEGKCGAALVANFGLLKKARRALGEDHDVTVSILRELGGMLRHLRRLSEAEVCLRGVLESRRRVLGQEHVMTLDAMHELALVLSEQEKYEKAEQIGREELETHRRTAGNDDPRTLSAIRVLGLNFWSRGKLSEAEAYLREHLEGCRRALAETDSQKIPSIFWRLMLLGHRGHFGKAESPNQEAHEKHVCVLSAAHEATGAIFSTPFKRLRGVASASASKADGNSVESERCYRAFETLFARRERRAAAFWAKTIRRRPSRSARSGSPFSSSPRWPMRNHVAARRLRGVSECLGRRTPTRSNQSTIWARFSNFRASWPRQAFSPKRRWGRPSMFWGLRIPRRSDMSATSPSSSSASASPRSSMRVRCCRWLGLPAREVGPPRSGALAAQRTRQGAPGGGEAPHLGREGAVRGSRRWTRRFRASHGFDLSGCRLSGASRRAGP